MNRLFSWILNNLTIIIPFAAFLIATLAFLIKRKEFKLNFSKPLINIKEISANPLINDGMGGQISSCYLKIELKNKSLSQNEVSVFLSKSASSSAISIKDKIVLPASKTTLIKIDLDYEKVRDFIDKEIFLTIKDIRGKMARKIFLFKSKK